MWGIVEVPGSGSGPGRTLPPVHGLNPTGRGRLGAASPVRGTQARIEMK